MAKPIVPRFVTDVEAFWSEPQPGWYPVIYALVDPRDESIHYVGFSKRPLKRLASHIHETSSNRDLASWIDGLLRWEVEPKMVVLERAEWETWGLQEARWIAYYRRNARLLNIEPGGPGIPGCSPETRSKIMALRQRKAEEWLGYREPAQKQPPKRNRGAQRKAGPHSKFGVLGRRPKRVPHWDPSQS